MDDFIQLKDNNILKIGIKDKDGKFTGEHLEFDLEDIEFPLKLNKCDIEHKKNLEGLRLKLLSISKKENKDKKYIVSYKDEEYIKAMSEFYKREMNALDIILGKNGTKKLLNGRNPYYTMYDDIGEILKPIMPKLKQNSKDIADRIKKIYENKENDVLE